MFRTGIETTETNRTLSKQTEKNQKNLQKTFSIRGPSKQLIFFLGLNRNKLKLNLFRLVCFFARPPNFFSVCFGVSDRYQNNRNKQNLKRLICLQICCSFGFPFVCFGCFETPKLPVSIYSETTETNVLFQIVPKLVSVPVSVVSI